MVTCLTYIPTVSKTVTLTFGFTTPQNIRISQKNQNRSFFADLCNWKTQNSDLNTCAISDISIFYFKLLFMNMESLQDFPIDLEKCTANEELLIFNEFIALPSIQ